MLKALAFMLVVTGSVVSPARADCLDVNDRAALVFRGQLSFHVFPGSPNYEDVRKGDRAEPGFLLKLETPICVRGDDFIESDRSIGTLHVFSSDRNVDMNLKRLAGKQVVVNGANAFGAHTMHHRAPLVVEAASVGPALDEDDEIGIGAISTVKGFYAALGAGDGREASRYIVPEKRGRGPFSAEAMTKFYGNMADPLRLLGVEAMSGGYRVHYRYRVAGQKACDGRAEVRLVTVGDLNLIAGIKALDGC